MPPQRGLMTSALDVRAVCVVLRSIVQAKMKPGNAATRCADPNWNIIESLLDSYSCLSPKRLDLLLGSGPKERTQMVAARHQPSDWEPRGLRRHGDSQRS